MHPSPTADPRAAAEAVRDACIAEALRAWEDAGMAGLCHEGRFEAVISALRVLDVAGLATPPDSALR